MSTFANVNVGTTANDHTGDPLRNSFIKINQNFANIAGGTAGGVTSVAGRVGNVVLTVNDVQGAANVYYVTNTVAAGNAYVDAAVASLGNIDVVFLTGRINVIDANLGVATNNITALTANAAAQAASINTLTANAAIQATSLNTLTANAASQAASINNLDSTITGIGNNVTSLSANAASQGASINTLTANAAAQQTQISLLNANVTAANSAITSLTANAALQAGSIDALTANATSQAISLSFLSSSASAYGMSIANLEANVSSLTSNAASQGASIASLTANAAVQEGEITALHGLIITAQADIDTLFANAISQQNNISVLLNNDTAQDVAIGDLQFDSQTLQNSIVALTGNAATQSIAITNLNATKANLAGATFTGNIVTNVGSETVNSRTGAIVVTGAGGIGCQGNVNIESQLFVGVDAQEPFLNQPITVERSTSSSGPGTQYTQHAIINATGSGSSDYIAYPNNYPGFGNDHGWIDVGIAGSAFDDPLYTITKPNDSYIFGSCPSYTSNGGNLVIATDNTGTYNDVVIAVNGFLSNNEIARFHSNGTTRFSVIGNVVVTANVTAANIVSTGVYATTIVGTNLTANAVSLQNQITGANAAIITANTGLKSYVDTQVSSLTTAWTANAGTQQTQISLLNANVTAANAVIAASTYTNANVASYLPTYTGNINAGNVTVGSVLTVASAIQFANLTTAQIDTIATPARGMTVYNYNTGNIQVYNGTKWANITLS